MGATLDETRVELEAQRARVRATAENLETSARRSLDIRDLVGRNPAKTAAVAGGLAFLLLGGPRRSVRILRRSLSSGADGERAYAALPATLRAFVDQTAPHGPSRDEARGEMAMALHAWRENPKNRKRADRLANETLTPPSPQRAFWALAETVAVTAGAVLARQFVLRSLAGRGLIGGAKPDAAEKATTAAGGTDSVPVGPDPKPSSKTAQYAGWSGRRPSTAGPAAKNMAPAAPAAAPTAAKTTASDANGDGPA